MKVQATKDPSTPGARWIFVQREYLRRVGSGKKNRCAFQVLRQGIEGSSDSELHGMLAAARQKKLDKPWDRHLTANLLLLESEFGFRRAQRRGAVPKIAQGVAVRRQGLAQDYERQLYRNALRLLSVSVGRQIVSVALAEAWEDIDVGSWANRENLLAEALKWAVEPREEVA